MLLALIAIPALAALAAFVIRADRLRRVLLVTASLAHIAVVAGCWRRMPGAILNGWLMLDSLGVLFLSITSLLFLAASVYGVGYLSREQPGKREDFEEGLVFSNAREAMFTGCLLLFLASMTLVCMSQHFGLLWVAMEATTLASAPLIYFHAHHRSLEATWKYLLICSVGIALALLGNFLLAVAASGKGGHGIPLVLSTLIGEATRLQVPWLKASFIFLLVGYGTKAGLAPLHTWLPDAHSESPSMVSALLSGSLLNCALLGILRSQQVCVAAGQGAFGRELLVVFGLLSMGVAAVFILRQPDYKRLLAYSSVEHMGILVLGIGLGGAASFGSMLHAVNHSCTKALLFLVAGNILAAYRTKKVANVQGVLRVLPVSGILWVAGLLAITGSPPFGLFVSELVILKSALDTGHIAIAVTYLALLGIIFIGMSQVVLGMAQGAPLDNMAIKPVRERILAIVPSVGLAIIVLVLGLYLPPALEHALRAAALVMEGA